MISVHKRDYTKLYDIAAQILTEYKRRLQNPDPVYGKIADAGGDLVKTADFDVDFDEHRITLYFNLASEWYYVEYGRGANTGTYGQWKNSVNDILDWMQRKSQIPGANLTIPASPQQQLSMAHSIVHKISKAGFYNAPKSTNSSANYGLHILRDTIEWVEQFKMEELMSAIALIYDREIDVAIEDI